MIIWKYHTNQFPSEIFIVL